MNPIENHAQIHASFLQGTEKLCGRMTPAQSFFWDRIPYLSGTSFSPVSCFTMSLIAMRSFRRPSREDR